MKFLAKPLTISLGIAILWYLLRTTTLSNYINGDEGTMASGTIAFLGVAYALLTGFMIFTVWGQWVAVEEAVKTKDYEKFLQHKDKRIPGTLKTLILLFSTFLLGAFFLTHFKHLLTGGFTIFAVSMVISTAWTVIMDLDDPFTGIWNVQIPEQWKEK